MNSKGIKTALKNLFPLWNNGKKKVKQVVRGAVSRKIQSHQKKRVMTSNN